MKSTPEAADMARKILLSAEGLGRQFTGRDGQSLQALHDVSFEASAACVTGIVGADGAGKTTLLRCAAGLLKADAGRISVLGKDPGRHPLLVQSRIGYMPQKFGLYEDLTVMENLSLYADLHSVPKKHRQERFDSLLDMTGLNDFTDRSAGALSGGMKQKLGIACALVKKPELLLLDEPTVGVDPMSRRDLWKIIYQLVDEEGVGVLLSTAYLDEAEDCHQVILLHEGQKKLDGKPSDFYPRVDGRVLVVDPEKVQGPRPVQTELLRDEHVIDATIVNGRVRILVASPPADTDPGALPLPERYRDIVRQVPPRFEDVFMDTVPQSEQQRRAARQKPREMISGKSGKDGVMVRARELVKRFGDFEAVRSLSFEVNRGEVFGLLGPNGAGKSTTFRMLCGLLPITSGNAEVAGRNLRGSRARARQRLGYMAQKFSLYEQLSVIENFTFFGRAYGLDRKRLRERIDWAVTNFGLGDYRRTPASHLPGGYRQRLSMAAALLHEPDILFLDEPTSGVDPLARREFWIRIGHFAEAGVAVVVTTHFMEEAEYCDRLLIMSRGRRLALGTPDHIRDLARSGENADPSIEDAFIALAEGAQ